MPRALFVSVGDLQNGLFAKRFAEQLQAYRKFWGQRSRFRVAGRGEAAGNTDPADAGDVRSDGENIGQIHLERVVRFFTDFERRGGRGGRDNGIHVLERFQKILANEGADLLGPQVIGIVVAAAEDVSAEDDAAFDFSAETGAARSAVELNRVTTLD